MSQIGHLPPLPPSLLHLTIDTAVQHIQQLHSLASIPDIIVLQIFLKTLAAGKLTEPVLQVFLATGSEQVLDIVKALKIQPIMKPVLPTTLQNSIKGEDFKKSAAEIDYLKSRLFEIKSSLPKLLQRINNCTHELEGRMKKLEKTKSRLSLAEDVHEFGTTKNSNPLPSLQEISKELGLKERKQMLETFMRESQSKESKDT